MPDRFDQYYASFRRGNSALRITLIVSVLVHVLVLLGLLGWYRLQLKTEPVTEFTMFVVPNERPDEPLEQATAPEVNELEQPDEPEAPPPPPPPPPPPEPEPPKPEPPKPEPPKPEPPKEMKKPEALDLDPEPEEKEKEPEKPKPEPAKPKEPEKPKPEPKPKDPEPPKKPTPEPPKAEPAKPEPPNRNLPNHRRHRTRYATHGGRKADRADLASWANRSSGNLNVSGPAGRYLAHPVSSIVKLPSGWIRNGNLSDNLP